MASRCIERNLLQQESVSCVKVLLLCGKFFNPSCMSLSTGGGSCLHVPIGSKSISNNSILMENNGYYQQWQVKILFIPQG